MQGPVHELEADNLSTLTSSLTALAVGEALAIRIRDVVPQDAAADITAKLLTSPEVSSHADVQGMDVLGLSHFQLARDPGVAERYADGARTLRSRLRSLSRPHPSPFDTCVALLVEGWAAGCAIMSLQQGKRPLAPFTIRIYHDGVGIDPHQDSLRVEAPNDPAAEALSYQFGANLFLSVPEAGGQLELYNEDHSYENHDLELGPRVLRASDLPRPQIITPGLGDLIIFSTKRVHAVAPATGPVPRITLSFFIGLRSEAQALQLWA